MRPECIGGYRGGVSNMKTKHELQQEWWTLRESIKPKFRNALGVDDLRWHRIKLNLKRCHKKHGYSATLELAAKLEKKWLSPPPSHKPPKS